MGRVHLQAIASRDGALCARHDATDAQGTALCPRCKAHRGLADLADLARGGCLDTLAGTAAGYLTSIAGDARGLCPEHGGGQ